MTTFSRIQIKGFRRLLETELELNPLSVLIGVNGVGKTSLLDIFGLLASSADGELHSKLSELGGLPAIITYDQANSLELKVTMPVLDNPPLDYDLTISPSGTSYQIEKETLTQHKPGFAAPFKHIISHNKDIRYFDTTDEKLMRPNWEHNYMESALSQVPKMFQASENFRKRLSSSTYYHSLNVDAHAPVRLPQPMRPAVLPGKNGEDLATCLFYLRETDRDRFETVEDTLHTAFPGFKRLDFPPVAAGTLAMVWNDENFTHPIYAHQLSEGTLRFLWLITLLQSPGLTAITLLDEPEVSLHPELLSLLAQLLRESARRTQLIVATHSDRLVRFLKPEEIVVMDLLDNGTASMTRGDNLDLDRWLKDFTMDELWAMGRI